MRKKKRTVTTVEAHQVFVIRRPDGAAPAWCTECPPGRQSVLVAAEAAAALTGLSTRAIYRLVEAGAVHFAETPEGALLVCLSSLPAAAGGDQLLK